MKHAIVLGAARDSGQRLYRRWRDSQELRWLTIGLLLRIAVMPFMGHNDVVWPPWMARNILLGHWNVYQYLYDTYGHRVLEPIVWAPYAPLYYYLTAAWLFIVKVLCLMNIEHWQTQWRLAAINRSLFLLKIPYLTFDLSTWLLLRQLVSDKKRDLLTALWMLCPVVIFVPYMMGQNDIYPAFFVALALYFAKRGLRQGENATLAHGYLASVALGLGAGFKIYPLLIVPPIAIILNRDIRHVLTTLVVAFLTFLVIVFPYLQTEPFIQGCLLNPEGQTILNLYFAPSASRGYIFLIGYFALLFYLSYVQQHRSFALLWKSGFAVLAWLMVTSPWPFDWFLWIVPFLTLAIVNQPRVFGLYVAQVSHFFVWILWWRGDMEARLLGAVAQDFASFGALVDIISRVYPYEKILGLSFSVFVVALMGIVYLAHKTLGQEEAEVAGHDISSASQHLSARALPAPLLVPAAILVVGTILAGRELAGAKQTEKSTEVVTLDGDVVAHQSFFSTRPNLRAVKVSLGTPDNANSAEMVFRLGRTVSSMRDLATATVQVHDRHRDKEPQMITFAAIPGSLGPLYFSLELSSGSSADSLAVRGSQGDSYRQGEAYSNEAPLGSDLYFEAVHSADWMGILRNIVARILADSGFFLVYAVICLSLTTLFALSGHGRVGVILIIGEIAIITWLSFVPTYWLKDDIRLLGYHVSQGSVEPGQLFSVTLYWQAKRPVEHNYTVFTHLIDHQGQIWAQHDGEPLHGYYPTSQWQVESLVSDTHWLQVAPDTDAGEYQLEVGMYNWRTGERLPVFSRGGSRVPYDRILLRDIRVLAQKPRSS